MAKMLIVSDLLDKWFLVGSQGNYEGAAGLINRTRKRSKKEPKDICIFL